MNSKKTINLGKLLLSLSDAIDLTSPVIAKHQQRTAYIALAIARAASLSEVLTKRIFIASLLHDTGAISAEEKIALYKFENVRVENHCIRGETLMRRIPEFIEIAPIIANHHRKWSDWDLPIESEVVFASQVVQLADLIERIIDRKRYILHQVEEIVDRISSLSSSIVHEKVKKIFYELAEVESFWLNLSFSKLDSLLFHDGPLKETQIDYYYLEDISKFFRDIIDFKSPFTATHTVGVSAAASKLALFWGLTSDEVLEIKIAGNLHDLGKLAIPVSILNKPSPLTSDELAIVKSHSYYTYQIISSIPGLEKIAEFAGFHHERLDGKGYPFHYDQDRITHQSRLISVADVFTALAEDRPYRKGMSKKQIINILNNLAKSRNLDKRIVELLLDNYNDVNEYVGTVQETTQEFYQHRLLEGTKQ